MGPWKLEALRIWRTRRLVALVGVFALTGLGDPALTWYLPELVKGNSEGVRVIISPPTPADAIASFAASAAQLGTLVIVLVAAASLAIYARPSLAAFYRTRLRRSALLVMPRYAAVTAASVGTLALGVLGAWYETTVLIGPLRPAELAGGLGLEALWACFTVAVVAAWASVARSVLAIAGWSLASLLALTLLRGVGVAASWLPAALAASAGNLMGGRHPGAAWQPILVTIAGTVALLAISAW
jgi:ABC-2 type transport system permease protein